MLSWRLQDSRNQSTVWRIFIASIHHSSAVAVAVRCIRATLNVSSPRELSGNKGFHEYKCKFLAFTISYHHLGPSRIIIQIVIYNITHALTYFDHCAIDCNPYVDVVLDLCSISIADLSLAMDPCYASNWSKSWNYQNRFWNRKLIAKVWNRSVLLPGIHSSKTIQTPKWVSSISEWNWNEKRIELDSGYLTMRIARNLHFRHRRR